MKVNYLAVLLCALALVGCDGADRALPVPAGSVVPEAADASNGVTAAEGQAQSDVAAARTAGEICVHVCGAVERPGLVRLAEGSRAYDALEAAGGFAEGAAEDVINLAGFVQDGEQLYFPTSEEASELRRQARDEQSGLVNINTADAVTLCTLPGIGESRAADIISYREANGVFKTPEEIMQVPGIKEGAFAKIKDRITVR